MSTQNRAIIVTGQTGTGKTTLSLELANQLNGELLSADSRQVYNALDIGTGKCDKPSDLVKTANGWTLCAVPIHGINLIQPTEIFSAGDFAEYATRTINEIALRGNTPIIVGGSGFYIKSLVAPDDTIAVLPNNALRHKYQNLEDQHQDNKKEYARLLQEDLKIADPHKLNAMNNSDRHNPRRLVRAIEVARSRSIKKAGFLNHNHYTIVGLKAPPEFLEVKITKRVQQMLESGYEEEVRKLSDKYGWSAPALKTIGYQEWQPYFAGEITKEELTTTIVNSHLRYARKQSSYLSRISKIHWIDVSDQCWKDQAVEYCKKAIQTSTI